MTFRLLLVASMVMVGACSSDGGPPAGNELPDGGVSPDSGKPDAGEPDSGKPDGSANEDRTFAFATEADVADGYFAAELLWTSRILDTKALLGAGCPMRVESTTEYTATGGCTDEEGLWAWEGKLHVTRTEDAGGTVTRTLDLDKFGFAVEGDFIGIWADGLLTGVYEKSPKKVDLTAKDLTVRLFGPWFPWNGTAWPSDRAVEARLIDAQHVRVEQAGAGQSQETMKAVVEMISRGRFELSADFHMDEVACNDEPSSGSLTLVGAKTVVFTFDDTCDQKVHYTVDGEAAILDLTGSVPLF